MCQSLHGSHALVEDVKRLIGALVTCPWQSPRNLLGCTAAFAKRTLTEVETHLMVSEEFVCALMGRGADGTVGWQYREIRHAPDLRQRPEEVAQGELSRRRDKSDRWCDGRQNVVAGEQEVCI
jgi:hypothetical protein